MPSRLLLTLMTTICISALALLVLLMNPGSPPKTHKIPAASRLSKKVVLTAGTGQNLSLSATVPVSSERFCRLDGGGLLAGEDIGVRRRSPNAPISESITIDGQLSGVYQFYVYDDSKGEGGSSTALSTSGAHVEIYSGDKLNRVFEVTPGREGNLWVVFALTGDTIQAIDHVCYEPDPGSVGRTLESALVPGDIVMGRIDDSLVPGKWSHVGIYSGDGKVIEAAAEDAPVTESRNGEWDYPCMTWVRYYRVVSADDDTRERAVEFARKQAELDRPYDINFLAKQRNGESWYCSELVWAAYVNASGGSINLEKEPDRSGVYPWEMECDDDIEVVGGHFEREPQRTWKVVYLALKTGAVHVWDWIKDLFR